jgi:hypothetical protein
VCYDGTALDSVVTGGTFFQVALRISATIRDAFSSKRLEVACVQK